MRWAIATLVFALVFPAAGQADESSGRGYLDRYVNLNTPSTFERLRKQAPVPGSGATSRLCFVLSSCATVIVSLPTSLIVRF